MISPINPTTLNSRHGQLTQQAQKLVAQTFYGTLMKQMHDSPFKSKLMDGGRGGEAFQPLMDQHLIDRISRSSSKKLVSNLVKRLESTHGDPAAKGSLLKPVTPADASSDHSSAGSQSHEKPPQNKSSRPAPIFRNSAANRSNPFTPVRIDVTPGIRA